MPVEEGATGKLGMWRCVPVGAGPTVVALVIITLLPANGAAKHTVIGRRAGDVVDPPNHASQHAPRPLQRGKSNRSTSSRKAKGSGKAKGAGKSKGKGTGKKGTAIDKCSRAVKWAMEHGIVDYPHR